MTYLESPNGIIYQGHTLEVLKGMEAESAQCCVTSPPYWGLRDYKLPPMVWDAVEGCGHEWGELEEHHDTREEVVTGKTRTTDRCYGDESRRFDGNHQKHTSGQFCSICGAWRGSLGLEPTPELFVQHIVQVFREVRRVLKKDGTLWLNLGDSYAASRSYQVNGTKQTKNSQPRFGRHIVDGLKPKDLVGIPWRVAFALQADGWWLRSDIIWSKPNPMPESVTDRPTKAHEYIFLLTKSAKYFWDAKAVKDPAECGRLRGSGPMVKPGIGRNDTTSLGDYRVRPSKVKGEFNAKGEPLPGQLPFRAITDLRNIRSVWTISTKPFSEAHFATFPEEIPLKCIKAGSRMGDVILDPFFGAGTVGLVAEKLGRRWIGIELNLDYCQMARERIEPNTKQGRLFV